MTGIGVADSSQTAVLGMEIGSPTHRRPYWHRDDALVAVTHVDPGFAELKRHFPESWDYLVRIKAIIDGIAALEAPAAVPSTMHLHRIGPLLVDAALELSQFAASQRGPGRETVAMQARASAERLRTYAHMGEWKPVELLPSQEGQPWLYCGPLNTWAMHTNHSSIGFLVVTPRPELQPAIDMVSTQRDTIRAVATEVLGGPVRAIRPTWPTMQATDMLLAGGESALGHKNFAHFFPLEAANSTVLDAEFTTVFANIHGSRLQRCSVPLLVQHQDRPAPADDDAILRASLAWFRCHDMAHFWRRADTPNDNAREEFTPFEAATLEEAYADTLGLLSAIAVYPDEQALSYAYLAELFRYLSRSEQHFADSAAAALTIGWLHEAGVFPESSKDEWLERSKAPVGELVRTIYRVLWEDGDRDGVEAIRGALRTGLAFRDRLLALYRHLPTDLEYTFG